MITVSARHTPLSELDADVVAVGVFKGGIEGPGTAEVLALLGLDDFPVTAGFRGDVGQTLRVSAPGQPFRSVLLVGLGRMDGISPALLRRAAGDVARATSGVQHVATTLAEVHPTRAALEAVADGLILGSYDVRVGASGHRPDATPSAERTGTLLVPSSLLSEAEAAISRATVVATAVAFARDLVNTPPGESRPPELATRIEAAMPPQIETQIHDEAWLTEHGCGGLLGVGRGSAAGPRLVELTYTPDAPLGHVVLAGKGITFDTGGINLKPAAGMPDMKSDMGGAAAVAGAVLAIAELGTRVKVTGLLALAENAMDGNAQLPSDVITTFDGTTVEVAHTDAEGRLVLADALGYAVTMSPDAVIDVATLTGAVVRALGPWQAGIMGNDEGVVDDVLFAAQRAGEPFWHLPLPEDMDAWLESSVADIDNLGKDDRGGGALLAGLFLRRFIGDVPWAHLDIAGPAFLSAELARGHQPQGGTGFGVTTLIEYLADHGG